MKEYRAYYNSILKDERYKLVKTQKRQESQLSLEIKQFHNDKDYRVWQNVWFFIVNGVIVAVADDWTENIEIFGDEW